jgi:hypothetical protein
MRTPPPSRYKVVERGRRLEVIDTRTGKPAAPGIAPSPSGQGGGKPGAGIDDGTFTTRRWYDAKAPRTIRLNFVTRRRLDSLRFGIAIAVAIWVVLSVWLWPFVPVFTLAALATPGGRKALRDAVTRFVNSLDQAA